MNSIKAKLISVPVKPVLPDSKFENIMYGVIIDHKVVIEAKKPILNFLMSLKLVVYNTPFYIGANILVKTTHILALSANKLKPCLCRREGNPCQFLSTLDTQRDCRLLRICLIN